MTLDKTAETFGLHNSLITPIGAKSRVAIEKYVGSIDSVFGKGEAFLVSYMPLESPNTQLVWKHERSPFINYPRQLWVDVNYRNYRSVYLTVFKDIMGSCDHVVDHIMNRRLARSLGYRFVRLLHVSRDANSSCGRGGETLAVENLNIGFAINPEINLSEIVYADPMDLLKMLNVKVGGFGLDAVRDNHYLFYS